MGRLNQDMSHSLYGRRVCLCQLTSIQLGGMRRVVREVLEESDLGQGEVASKQRHHFHVHSVSGLGSQRHGDDTTALPTHGPVAAVVHN